MDPNTETEAWDPSDPEEHTRLLTTKSDPKALRVTRARAIRLAKAENKRTAVPPLCSFNLEAFGLMFVELGMDEPGGPPCPVGGRRPRPSPAASRRIPPGSQAIKVVDR